MIGIIIVAESTNSTSWLSLVSGRLGYAAATSVKRADGGQLWVLIELEGLIRAEAAGIEASMY
jgi:hypothetical protein